MFLSPLLLQCSRVLDFPLGILKQSSDLTAGAALSTRRNISSFYFYIGLIILLLLYSLDKPKYIN